MKFLKLNGRPANVNVAKHIIDWDHKVSAPQKKVKDFLRPYWCAHVCLEEFRIPGTLMRVDLMNLTRHIAVEVSPKGSHDFNPFFHKNETRFGKMLGRELEKAKWLEMNGYTIVEVLEDDFAHLSPTWFLDTYGIVL